MNQTTSSAAIIELVDSEILARGSAGQWLRSPGYALLDSAGVTTGDQALEQAWLYPQRSFNQYWHQLNLSPLPAGNQFARHYADLAYAQLHQLHQQLGAPGEILFAIPGSFSRDQLAILLGLANALPVKTLGLIDTAVAATAGLGDCQGELLHLDIHLHQAVITRLRADPDVTRESVEVIPDAGLKHFYGGWAQYIANLFIREYRYDPLHTADSEQQLYSRLPVWLATLASQAETTVELSTPRGNFRLSLQRNGLLESSLPRINRMRQALADFDVAGHVLASYRLGKLPGLAAQLNARVLDEQQVISTCQNLLGHLDTDPNDASPNSVDFVTHLPRQGVRHRQPSVTPAGPARASHLLYGHRAWPLGDGLGIEITAGGLRVSRDPAAPLRIETTAGHVRALNRRYDIIVSGNLSDLRPGDLLRVDGHELRLIEVSAEA